MDRSLRCRPSLLPPALDAERREMSRRAGRLSYYVSGEGRPLLLVHSVNAAASAFEMRPLFAPARLGRRVYAVDLPGFGFSDRSDRDYSVALYVTAVEDMLAEIEVDCGESSVDTAALSLGSEFVARVAALRPERFCSLTLITPTGFSNPYQTLNGDRGETREMPGLHRLVTAPLWSEALFRALTSRASLRYFLRRTFGPGAIDESLLEYAYRTSHQPGAKHAPLAFLCGRLFSKDIQAVYRRLAAPVWMPHATRGDFKDFSAAGWARSHPLWTIEPFPTGALPQFEQPTAFLDRFARFLTRPRAT